ncbi:MAG: 30S ribosomal protein S19 [Candidatus Undinarchaeales archaeon]|jgi:small subunit ribosomal protein S19|nr:30S ribosomal protein S19 [Candidatus Undinarchaeales archaeon]MDP7494697.1 30S ribosomal protein S19 [Candidatus Undinarchaeales archaeon]
MVRKFKFQNMEAEELSTKRVDQVLHMLSSRARRSIKRGLLSRHRKFLQRLKVARENPNVFLRTHLRDMIVLPDMIGMTIGVYNGKEYVRVSIDAEMVGHYLGEFAPTRKRVEHSAPGVGATRSSMYVPLK